MGFLFDIDHKYLAGSALALTSGVAVYSTYKLWQARRSDAKANVYENQKFLNEYLVFHYGSDDQVLRYNFGPKESLNFARKCGELCISHYNPKSGVPPRVLDIGCAVGRSSFEMARVFDEVVGIDYSHSFVAACNTLKRDGTMNYEVVDEGELTTDLTATVDKDIDRERVNFQQGDACHLPDSLGKFGCVLAANLICRLQNPFDFLNRMPDFVAKGGVLVITSPYTIMEEFTPKKNWFGGYKKANGERVTGFQTLQTTLCKDFELIEEQNMPFFIRETARKNQWTVAQATVWRRK